MQPMRHLERKNITGYIMRKSILDDTLTLIYIYIMNKTIHRENSKFSIISKN